jgi:pilus assembly protein CpaE
MAGTTRILIASRSPEAIERLKLLLAGAHDFRVASKLIVNGHSDPLEGLRELPDLLILRVSDNSANELEAQFRRDPAARCPLVVVSGTLDPSIMRLAMQAGARDFLTEPVEEEDLLGAIVQIASEQRVRSAPRGARKAAFVNASGGCGATFLAANIAHLLQVGSQRSTALVDLDLQFAPLAHYLDVEPTRDLFQALAAAGELDDTALRGYMIKHASGLEILAARPERAEASGDAVGENYRPLMDLLDAGFEHVVYDVPNHLDLFGLMTLERADHVVIVMQQSLPSLRNAVRLAALLRGDLAVDSERIAVVVNRYRKGAGVDLPDIERALGDLEILRVPNHFQPVSESIAMGVPLLEHARNSPVVKALREIEERVGGHGSPKQKSLFTKTFNTIMRS